jgi:hypothetical protein
MRETIRLIFALGGASAPVWSYGEALGYAGSHPPTVTRASLRSLLSTVVPSLRPLVSSRTLEPRQLGKHSFSLAPPGYCNT